MSKSYYKLSDTDVAYLWDASLRAHGVATNTPFTPEDIQQVKREFVRYAMFPPYMATPKDLAYVLHMSSSAVIRMMTTIVNEMRAEHERAKQWQFQSRRLQKSDESYRSRQVVNITSKR